MAPGSGPHHSPASEIRFAHFRQLPAKGGATMTMCYHRVNGAFWANCGGFALKRPYKLYEAGVGRDLSRLGCAGMPFCGLCQAEFELVLMGAGPYAFGRGVCVGYTAFGNVIGGIVRTSW